MYWTFDEADGSNAVDLVQGITLTPTNNAVRVDNGVYGKALYFNGEIGCRFINESTGIKHVPSQLWVCEMLVKRIGSPADDGETYNTYIMDFGEDGRGNDPAFIYGFSGHKFELFGLDGRTENGGVELAESTWHRVVMAFYGRTGFGITNRHDICCVAGHSRPQ